MVVRLERDADLHTAQLMPLPLTVYCFSNIQTGFTFLVPAHPGSPGQRAIKRECVQVFKIWYKQLKVYQYKVIKINPLHTFKYSLHPARISLTAFTATQRTV